MEINSNKAGISRSIDENRTLSKALQAKDISSSSSAKPDLDEGQLLKGTVLDLRYNEVKIRLEPGQQVITAKLSGEVPLAIGEEARFQVSEDSGNRLMLKFLPEDTAPTDSAILKALTASGLPLTDRNKAILSELLKYRMPIDKQTLQTLIKAAVMNREASPQSLVLMLKNSIPLTSSNIRQFEAYQNGTGKLITDIQNLTKSLSELFVPTKEVSLNPTTSAATNTVLPLSSPSVPTSTSLQSMVQSVAQDLSLPLLEVVEQSPTQPTTQPTVQAFAQPNAQTSDQTLAQGTALNVLPDNLSQTPEARQNIALSLNDSLLQILLKESEAITQADPSVTNIPDALNSSALPKLSEFLTDAEQTNLGQLIRQLPEGTHFADQLAEGSATTTEILKLIGEQLPKAGSEASKAILQSPEYAKLLTEAFHQRWTITPEKLEQKGSVSELYRKLQDDMDAFRLLGQSEEKLLESLKFQEPVKNLQENLSFMKDLNQMFTYLQLPVQAENQDIPSELYVFTNKKALKTKKDLSVLLHLDMPNLGALNIHVTLEHTIVNAKFYPEEKTAKSILTSNVPSLSEALQKRGYTFHYEVMDVYQKPDFVKDFIERNAGESSPARYTFDIRA